MDEELLNENPEETPTETPEEPTEPTMEEPTPDPLVAKIQAILGEEVDVSVYLDLAKQELMTWVFGEQQEEFPTWLEPVCVMAVVVAVNVNGGEGENSETVDGVRHDFKYDTMINFIHRNAPGHAKLI